MKPCLMFDLDNTVMGGGYEPYARLPEHFCRLLDELTERGWTWVTNTARTLDDQWDILLGSPVRSRPLAIVSEFGRRIAFPKGDGYECWTDYEQKWVDPLHDVDMRKIQPLIAQIMTRCPLELMTFHGHEDHVHLARREDLDLLNQLVAPWLGDEELEFEQFDTHLFIRPRVINKGNAVRALQEAGLADAGKMICAGDSLPDLRMLRECAYPICSANAAERVREYVKAHDVVSKFSYSDGIRDAIGLVSAQISVL